MIIDLHLDERLGAREACDPGKPPQADVPEPSVDELVGGVDLTGVRAADRGFVSIFRADAVSLDLHGSAARRQPMQRVQQPEGVLDSVEDAEAVDEVEAVVGSTQFERVHAPILDGRAEQAMKGAEALAADKLDAPPGRDPEPVLLVVHCNDLSAPRCSARNA